MVQHAIERGLASHIPGNVSYGYIQLQPLPYENALEEYGDRLMLWENVTRVKHKLWGELDKDRAQAGQNLRARQHPSSS